MARKRSPKGPTLKITPLDTAERFQEAVEIAGVRRQEGEKECRVHYRAVLHECQALPPDDQKRLVEEATDAYRDMLAACRMRFEAEVRSARVILDASMGQKPAGKRK
ncbi:MAG: hypothetical protein ACYTAF_02325 [Planctomycetota bacterium]|jgi:hypothetical protein